MISSLIKEQLTIAKTLPTPYIFAPLLGLSLDVAFHLRSSKTKNTDVGKSIVETTKVCSSFEMFLPQLIR